MLAKLLKRSKRSKPNHMNELKNTSGEKRGITLSPNDTRTICFKSKTEMMRVADWLCNNGIGYIIRFDMLEIELTPTK